MALPAEDTADRLTALVSTAERRIRNALYSALTAAREEGSAEQLAALALLIEQGRFDEALERAAAAGSVRLAEEYAAVYVLSGLSTSGVLRDALEVAVGFDQVNQRAVNHLQQQTFRLVRDFTAEQRSATREALAAGTARGLNPRDQARTFRQSIGLTTKQQRAVDNYRALLEAGSSDALSRQLRDRRFDRTVARAVEGTKPLTKAQVDRMVLRYSERYVHYRSEVIARTEALRAVHSANEEAYQQAIDAGHVRPDQLERTWVSALDERVRGSHSMLHGQVRLHGETWNGADGELRFPGDPDAPASETVQCRCSLATRLA